MVVSLQKSNAEADAVPYISLVPMTRPTVVTEQIITTVSAETVPAAQPVADEQPDRALRHRIILGNVIAWLVIIVAVRLIFF